MAVGTKTGEKKLRDICRIVWRGFGHWMDWWERGWHGVTSPRFPGKDNWCIQMFLMEIYNSRGRNTHIWREKTYNIVVDICSLRCLWNIQVRGPVGRCRSHETGQDQRHKVGNHQLIGGTCDSGRKWHYQGWPSPEVKRGKDSENSGIPQYLRGK